MAITKSTVTSMQALAEWLQANAVPEYFASVSIDAKTITGSDANGNPLMVYSVTNHSFSIYKTSGGNAETFTIATSSYSNAEPTTDNPAIAAKCGGGLMVLINREYSGSASGWYCLNFIITKTNNDITAVIAGTYKDADKTGASVTSSTTNIHSVALGDATDAAKTHSFTVSAENQTQFVSFTTYAKPDTTSFTPNAFYMPVGEYYDWSYGKFTAGGDTYITNGYWAIKDA